LALYGQVLSLLGGEQADSVATYTEKTLKVETTSVVQMPDLIDTGDSDDCHDGSTKDQSDQNLTNLSIPAPLIDDIFGGGLATDVSTSEPNNVDDPFADVSFHAGDGGEHADDLFSGMTVDRQSSNEILMEGMKNGTELLDIFGSNLELPQGQETPKKDVNDLMSGLSINENASNMQKKGTSVGAFSENMFSDSNSHPGHQVTNDSLSSMFSSPTAATNANAMFPFGAMPYNIPSGFMFNPAFSSQPMNYAAMGSLFAQQQLLAKMSELQPLGDMNGQNVGVGHFSGTDVAYSSALPDIFKPNFTTQTPSSLMNSSKKEETRAFDFISVSSSSDTFVLTVLIFCIMVCLFLSC
jgi:hypothetical protein